MKDQYLRIYLNVFFKIWFFLGPILVLPSLGRFTSLSSLQNSLNIPVEFRVALLGFESNDSPFAIEAIDLALLLQQTLPSYQPSCWESSAKIRVTYALNWTVSFIPRINQLEFLIGKFAEKYSSEDNTFTVNTRSVLSFFDEVLKDFPLHSLGQNHKQQEQKYTIFVVNPNKNRIQSQLSPTLRNFQYLYRVDNEGFGTQVWISPNRYVVVDLSAGPLQFGMIEAEEKGPNIASLPVDRSAKLWQSTNDPVVKKRQQSETLAFLTTLCVAAVQHAFITDIKFNILRAGDKVLIPIVVFRNHQNFDPWDVNQNYSIDLFTIKEHVSKFFLPHQNVEFISALHSLHTHKHISMALYKSIRTVLYHELIENRRYKTSSRQFIDSKMLLHFLKHTTDLLGSGLIDTDEETERIFTNPNIPKSLSLSNQETSQGTRILPVYVFSLVGMPRGLLLEDHQLVAATQDGVIVLQTDERNVSVPYFHSNKYLTLDALQLTKNIIAGIAMSLGGLTEPFKHYSFVHKSIIADYLWSIGYHPFGPFASTTTVSRVYIDTIIRNHITSRVNFALQNLDLVAEEIDRFAKEYMYDPFGEEITHPPKTLLSEFGYQQTKSLTLKNTIERLREASSEIDLRIAHIAFLLSNYELEEAYKQTLPLEKLSSTLLRYVRDELKEVESEITCCYLHIDIVHEIPLRRYAIAAFLSVVLFIVISYALSTKKIQQSSWYNRLVLRMRQVVWTRPPSRTKLRHSQRIESTTYESTPLHARFPNV